MHNRWFFQRPARGLSDKGAYYTTVFDVLRTRQLVHFRVFRVTQGSPDTGLVSSKLDNVIDYLGGLGEHHSA